MTLRIIRWLGIAAVVIGYPLLAHHTNRSAHASSFGAWVALAPVLLLAAILAWRSTKRALMLSLVAASCIAMWWTWPTLENNYDTIYWLQHAGMQVLLLAIFGRTLTGGREPLCTRFARTVHAPIILSPQQLLYTRRVTQAWAIFFALVALTSTLLFFFAPLETWSFFANFLTLPLVVLMFVAEYKIRTWAVPGLPSVHILEGVRAFQKAAGPTRPS